MSKKAYLINAETRTISEIVLGDDYTEISKAIGCELFTCIGLNDNGDTLYVDDEGLLTLTPFTPFFLYKGYNQPLAGNGVILGTDDDGESIDPKMTLEEVRKNISWMTLKEARQFGE